MLIYLLKMIACSTVFYALYALLFQKEKMLVFNRFYLLGGLVAAFVIPLITITVEIPAAKKFTEPAVIYQVNVQGVTTSAGNSQALKVIIVVVFAIISLGLLTRFFVNLYTIQRMIKRGKRVAVNKPAIVLLNEKIAPYSFLNTIFLNRNEFENGEVEKEVLAHELAHVHQKHTWDIIFIELLQVFCWFNPIIYLYRRSVKINHELLADAAVIKQAGDVRSYQQVLLQRAIAQSSLALVSSFTFYTTKKRLIMLQKKHNKARTTAIGLLTLPVLAAAIAMGCNTANEKKETVLQDDAVQSPGQSNVNSSSETQVDTFQISIPDTTEPPPPPPPKVELKKMTPPKIIRDFPEGPGATPAEFAGYDAMVQKAKVGENRYKLNESDFGNMLSIYKKMTLEQRRKAMQLPPPPPPKVEMKKFSPPRIIKDEESKTPSLTIDKDGSIAMNGVPVKKVFVDGKEFSPARNAQGPGSKSFQEIKIIKDMEVREPKDN